MPIVRCWWVALSSGRRRWSARPKHRSLSIPCALARKWLGLPNAETVRSTVWIDRKTFTPLKRKVVVGDRDEKLDAKVFKLPK